MDYIRNLQLTEYVIIGDLYFNASLRTIGTFQHVMIADGYTDGDDIKSDLIIIASPHASSLLEGA